MASSIVLKFISSLGNAITVEGATLTDVATALSNLNQAQAINLLVQTGASATGILGNADPLAAGASIVMSAAGVGTGINVLKTDKAQAIQDQTVNGTPTQHDVLTLKSDIVTILGDAVGAVGGILNLYPTPTPFIKQLAIGDSIASAALTLLSVGYLAADFIRARRN